MEQWVTTIDELSAGGRYASLLETCFERGFGMREGVAETISAAGRSS